MERTDTLVDLGTATVETKGIQGENKDLALGEFVGVGIAEE